MPILSPNRPSQPSSNTQQSSQSNKTGNSSSSSSSSKQASSIKASSVVDEDDGYGDEGFDDYQEEGFADYDEKEDEKSKTNAKNTAELDVSAIKRSLAIENNAGRLNARLSSSPNPSFTQQRATTPGNGGRINGNIHYYIFSSKPYYFQLRHAIVSY